MLLNAAIAAIAACGGESTGVMIRVHAPPAGTPQPDEVRLMIGGTEVNDHMAISISPPLDAASVDLATTRFRRGAQAWFRDPIDGMSTSAISAAEPATFLFQPSTAGAELGVVIAVGYGRGAPLQAPLSVAAVFHPTFVDGQIYVYDLHLAPAVDPSAAVANRTAPDQLQLWGPDQSCVYFRTTSETGSDHQEAFLITSDTDRDCDGLDNTDPLECMNTTHDGSRPPIAKELSCTAPAQITMPGAEVSVCTLGGPPCVDGEPPAGCTPSRYCAPDTVCTRCATEGPACMFEFPIDQTITTIIMCDVPVRGTGLGTSISYELCPGTSEALPLRPLVVPDELQCDRSTIRNVQQPFASALEDTDPATPDTWKYDVDVDASCGLTLVASGVDTTLANTQGVKRTPGLLAIDLSRMGSSGSNRDLAIPIRFTTQPVTTCPERPACRVEHLPTNGTLAQCLLAEPPAIDVP